MTDKFPGWDTKIAPYPTCPRGCHPCGSGYYQTKIHSGSCCGSSICDTRVYRATEKWLNVTAWLDAEKEYNQQVSRWLMAEDLYQVECEEWLEAERAFKRTLRRAAPKRVKAERKERTPVTKAAEEARAKMQKLMTHGR